MDTISLLKAVFALLFVLALIGLLAGLARKYRLPERLAGVGIKSGRLRIVESLALDAKRRLMLVECDGVQHLLLLGEHDTVIQSSITPPISDAKTPSTSA